VKPELIATGWNKIMGHHHGETDEEYDRRKAAKKAKKEKIEEGLVAPLDSGWEGSPAAPAAPAAPPTPSPVPAAPRTTAIYEDFLGEREEGLVYLAENTRPIDVVMELLKMLREDKLYGQPGTDGTFWSNVTEVYKNDNDIIGMWKINEAHSFTKVDRFFYLFTAISINFVINSWVKTLKVADIVSIMIATTFIALLKMATRAALDAECFIHDKHSSDLRDVGRGHPNEVVAANKKKNEQALMAIFITLRLLTVVMGAGGAASIATQPQIRDYIITFIVSTVLTGMVTIAIKVLRGKYNDDREEFEMKWGALQYDGQYVHPKSITDVAIAVLKAGNIEPPAEAADQRGGILGMASRGMKAVQKAVTWHHPKEQPALKHLDEKTQEMFSAFFIIDGKGKDQQAPECWKSSLEKMWMSANEKMEASYMARFIDSSNTSDSTKQTKKVHPYDLFAKERLYPAAVKNPVV
jgi:hypothetical protein